MPDEQILAQAVLEKNPTPSAPGGGLSSEQQKAANIRTEMGGNDTLASFNAALNVTRNIDKAAGVKTLDANFGIDRDPASGLRTKTEAGSQARFDRASTALTQVEELLGSGIVTDRAGAIAKLELVMSVLPGYDNYLGSLSVPEKVVLMDGLMKDPKFLEKARAGYERATVESSRLTDEVTSAKKKADELEAARVKKHAEGAAVGGVGGTLQKAREAESSFADTTTASAKGTELEALQKDAMGAPRDLEAEERDAQNSRTRAKTLFDARNRRFTDLATNKPPTDSDYIAAKDLLDTAQTDLGDAETAYSNARKDRARRMELEREKAELPGKIRTLEAENVRLIGEYSDAEKAALLAKADLNSKQIDRYAAEEAYASAAERVLPDALREYLREQTQGANEANRRILDKQITEAKSKTDADVLKMIKERYLGLDKKGNIVKYDARVGADVAYLLNGKGGTPDEMVRASLDALYPPDPVTHLPNPKVAEFMGDSDFVKRHGSEMAKNAFTQYIQSGGKISEAQQLYIEAQPWGQNMAEQIFNSPTLKAKEKEMIENGQLPPGGFREAMKAKDKDGRSKMGWLLLIAAGILVPVYGQWHLASEVIKDINK